MHAGPHVSALRALDVTSNSLNSQAQFWAYVDVFRYLALMCAVCIPVAFLLKKPSTAKAGG